MMRGASVFAWVRSFQRSLLSSVAFKYGGIQVHAVAPFTLWQSLHLLGPQRRVESVILSLPKTLEPVADGIVGREPSNPQHLLQGLIGAQQSRVCKTSSPRQHRQQKRRERLHRINRVGRGQAKRQVLPHRLRIADLSQKLPEPHQAPKGCHRPLLLRHPPFPSPVKPGYLLVALFCSSSVLFHPISI